MKLPFFNRTAEKIKIIERTTKNEPSLMCLYGRRRCGKSRLLLETLEKIPHVYFAADQNEERIAIDELAREIETIIPGFGNVQYPSWKQLFDRWGTDAPSGAVLAIDEFPYLVATSPQLPGVFQKYFDRHPPKPLHYIFCGSSQRMMTGAFFESTSPLYGRASEILDIKPLSIYFIKKAFNLSDPSSIINTWAIWGGVPRYWELALDHKNPHDSARDIILDPQGILHDEPLRLLSDELAETRQASSILFLIAQGCHRISEIATRLNKPATSLTRPIALLINLGFVRREIPFGESLHNTKRSLYFINDPFLKFWFRFIEPNRSLCEAGVLDIVQERIGNNWNTYCGEIWEVVARKSVPHISIAKTEWLPASRWWGKGVDGKTMEIDIIAQASNDKNHFLAGEVKLSAAPSEYYRILNELKEKVSNCPVISNKNCTFALWVLNHKSKKCTGAEIISGDTVINSFADLC